ncbi:FG-GAP-like repeat-containing protein, partial [bacterium]|nr:FG-GAP-like repeat-containing protein [bacterium]
MPSDYNNDGYEDILAVFDSPNIGFNLGLYQNKGNQSFVDVSATAFPNEFPVISATVNWVDLDNDGDLDFITSKTKDIYPASCAPSVFMNNNDQTFTKIPGQMGFTADINSIAAGDYDNDGNTDIFFAIQYYQLCDRKSNVLLHNNGSRSFTDVTSTAFDAVAFSYYNGFLGDAVNCFFFDCDNDGNLDLFVGGKGQSYLFHNNGNGKFTDLASEAGIRGAYNLNSATCGDFNNDGYLDLFIPNASESPGTYGTKPRHALYLNRGDGTFGNIAMDLGVDRYDHCYNVITGDIDNDGDLDIYLDGVGIIGPGNTIIWSKAILWRNEGNINHWFEVKTVGTISNRDGIGTRLKVTAGGMTQIREVGGGSGLPLKNDLRAHFGLGSASIVNQLEIRWPSGIVQTLTNLPADQILTITEDPGNIFVVGLPEIYTPAASDVTIPLFVRSAVDIIAANVTIRYNPVILSLNSITKTPFTKNFSLQTNTSTPGEITIGLAAASFLNGDGDLVNIEFSTIGSAGAISYLDIVTVTFNEGTSVAVVDDGRLTIQEGTGYDISGTVTYWIGDQGIPGVDLDLSGSGVASATTTELGDYELLSIPVGDYTLLPSKNDGINGISEFDAARVLQNVVGLYGFNGYQEISADVSGNESSTSFDASLLLQYAVGLITLPFSGVGKVWDFIPTDYSYSLLNSDMVDQDFIGILYGDVSGNWSASSQSMERDTLPPAGQLANMIHLDLNRKKQSIINKIMGNGCTVSIPDAFVESNTHITLPLFVDPGDGIVSFEVTVIYDTTIVNATDVALTSLSDGFMLSYNLASPGILRVACACANEIVGSGAILELGFDVADKDTGSSVIELTDVLINEGLIQTTIQNGCVQLGMVQIQYEFSQQGWYMISLPVIPEDSSVSTLFPTALGNMAFGWDPVGGAYTFETEVKTKYGYWIAIPGATTSQVSGEPLNNYTIHCGTQGWYIIGSVLGSTDFTNPDDNPDGQVLSPAFGWNAGTGSYILTTTLEEKNGYWAAVFGECDLTVGGGGLPKPLAQTEEWNAFADVHGSTPPEPPNIEKTVGEMVQIPTAYGFSQNYPNP